MLGAAWPSRRPRPCPAGVTSLHFSSNARSRKHERFEIGTALFRVTVKTPPFVVAPIPSFLLAHSEAAAPLCLCLSPSLHSPTTISNDDDEDDHDDDDDDHIFVLRSHHDCASCIICRRYTFVDERKFRFECNMKISAMRHHER